MKVWCKSSLCYVEPDMEPGEGEEGKFTLRAVKNGYASCQILVRSEKSFRIREIRFEGLEQVDCRYHFQETIEFDKGRFQDPLSNALQTDVKENYTQSIWVTVFAGEESGAGTKEGVIKIVTDLGTFETGLTLVLYNCCIPSNREAAFVTEYWMNGKLLVSLSGQKTA